MAKHPVQSGQRQPTRRCDLDPDGMTPTGKIDDEPAVDSSAAVAVLTLTPGQIVVGRQRPPVPEGHFETAAYRAGTRGARRAGRRLEVTAAIASGDVRTLTANDARGLSTRRIRRRIDAADTLLRAQ